MKDYRNLKVWEKAHQTTLTIYRITAAFPKDELYGLTSQIRRSGASIPANIAEGCGRETDADFARFLQIAAGSASELDYHLLLARDLKFMGDQDYMAVMETLAEVRKMLTGLIKRLRANR